MSGCFRDNGQTIITQFRKPVLVKQDIVSLESIAEESRDNSSVKKMNSLCNTCENIQPLWPIHSLTVAIICAKTKCTQKKILAFFRNIESFCRKDCKDLSFKQDWTWETRLKVSIWNVFINQEDFFDAVIIFSSTIYAMTQQANEIRVSKLREQIQPQFKIPYRVFLRWR